MARSASLALVALLAATGANAATFTVNPTQVHLSPKATSALLSLRNESGSTLRFQLSVSAWAQSLTGEMQLTPTREIVFFPTLVTLAPKEERKIRVGAVVAAGALEKTYRLMVEELPPPEKPGQAGVQMLTKMSIPIFFEPAAKKGQATLKDLAVRNGAFAFRLANDGTVHFTPTTIRVRALDAAGLVVAEQKLDPWYILAATEREYTVTVPKPACSRVVSFVVDVQIDKSSLTERLQTPAGACGG